jgi:hypothetical protein
VGASAYRLCKFRHVICPRQMYRSVFTAKAFRIVELCDATVNTSTYTSILLCPGYLSAACAGGVAQHLLANTYAPSVFGQALCQFANQLKRGGGHEIIKLGGLSERRFRPVRISGKAVDLGEVVRNLAVTGRETAPNVPLVPGQTESWWAYERECSCQIIYAADPNSYRMGAVGQRRSLVSPH